MHRAVKDHPSNYLNRYFDPLVTGSNTGVYIPRVHSVCSLAPCPSLPAHAQRMYVTLRSATSGANIDNAMKLCYRAMHAGSPRRAGPSRARTTVKFPALPRRSSLLHSTRGRDTGLTFRAPRPKCRDSLPERDVDNMWLSPPAIEHRAQLLNKITKFLNNIKTHLKKRT